MEITEEVVDQLSHLARLEFDVNSKQEIIGDLNRILAFCEQLNGLDTSGIEPLIYMSDVSNGLREDTIEPALSKSLAFKNAPKADSDFFRVPKVLNKKK